MTSIVGRGVYVYRLLALRSAIKLEARGLHRSRGPSATAIVRREMGLPKGARRATVLEALEAVIAAEGVTP